MEVLRSEGLVVKRCYLPFLGEIRVLCGLVCEAVHLDGWDG